MPRPPVARCTNGWASSTEVRPRSWCSPAETQPTTDEHECEPLSVDDLDEVVRFDAPRFGAPRRELLAKVIDQHPGRALVLRRRGKVAGYLVAQEATLAPVVTDTSESLVSLVTAALAARLADSTTNQRAAGERSRRHDAASRLRAASRIASHAQRYRGVARPPREHRRPSQPRRGLIECLRPVGRTRVGAKHSISG